jgi:hypothetical protein
MIKQMLTTNWNFMRVLRLGFGLLFIVQAIQNRDIIIGFIAAIFLFQAVTNTGCCGINSCATLPKKTDSKNSDVIYEEIK